jgi:hypothetical protein
VKQGAFGFPSLQLEEEDVLEFSKIQDGKQKRGTGESHSWDGREIIYLKL